MEMVRIDQMDIICVIYVADIILPQKAEILRSLIVLPFKSVSGPEEWHVTGAMNSE